MNETAPSFITSPKIIWSNRTTRTGAVIGNLRYRRREVMDQLIRRRIISEDFAVQPCTDLGIQIDSEFINWLWVGRYLEQRKMAEGIK